jgi:hypothetical protein
LLLIQAFAFTARSQVYFGFKGGLTIAEMLASRHQTATISSYSMEMTNYPRTNINAGIFLGVPLSRHLYFQPELLYTNQGSASQPRYNYVVSATETYKFNYLHLPLLIKYCFPSWVYVATGPQFGLLLDAKIDQTIVDKNHTYYVTRQYKPTDFGWSLAVGYIGPMDVGIDVRYNLGFTDINNTSAAAAATIPVQNGRFRNSGLQIDIFITL